MDTVTKVPTTSAKGKKSYNVFKLTLLHFHTL